MCVFVLLGALLLFLSSCGCARVCEREPETKNNEQVDVHICANIKPKTHRKSGVTAGYINRYNLTTKKKVRI